MKHGYAWSGTGERARLATAGPPLAKVPRPVRGCARYPVAGRLGDFGRVVVVRTRYGIAVRNNRHQRDRSAECGDRLRPGGSRGNGNRRLAPDVGRTGACDSRRRSAGASRLRTGAWRHHPDRSGRHRACRRPCRRVVQPADVRGGADGRKPSGPEGFRADYGRCRAW